MKQLLLLIAAGAMMLSSCNKDDNDPGTGGATAGGGDIVFNIGIGSQMQTKVATGADFKSAFENGDEIGIFAVRRASGETKALATAGNYIHNVKLTYSTDGGGKWTAASGLWFPNNGDVLDFYAYYPYNDNNSSPATLDPTAITFNVQADQSTALNYGKSDLLSAKLAGVARGTEVDLSFAHQLSLVQVEVDPGTIKGSGPSDALALTLNNCKAGGAFNLGDGNLATVGNAAAVKMLRVETDPATATTYTYRALVPAQSVAQGASLCLMAQNGQLYNTPTLAAALTLTEGKAQRYTAKLPATALQTTKITHGTFTMGEEGWATPVHEVTLTKDFYMSKYQITNAQYAAFLNANSIGSGGKWASGTYPTETLIYMSSGSYDWGLHYNTNKWEPATGKDNFPVINVTWFGAKAYADWVGGSLPTEAQWEYACRAGETTAFWFGTNDTDMGNYGWSYENSSDGTKAVGQKTANPWGLYDMHGNVWEWCSDWYRAYTDAAVTDPTGADSGSYRVLRGGSWYYNAQFCRSAYRFNLIPGDARNAVGFRVVFVP